MRLRTRPTSGPRTIPKDQSHAAFTFAEVLAALVFMAIVIPVAMQGLQIANRAGVVAERKGIAVQLADQRLSEEVTTGNWRNSTPSGDFGEDWKDFHWQLDHDVWTEDTMRRVSVEVTYQVQNQEYSVRLSTLVNDSTP